MTYVILAGIAYYASGKTGDWKRVLSDVDEQSALRAYEKERARGWVPDWATEEEREAERREYDWSALVRIDSEGYEVVVHHGTYHGEL